jgi:hypothetical protein
MCVMRILGRGELYFLALREKLTHVGCIFQDVNTTLGATHSCIMYHYQFP